MTSDQPSRVARAMTWLVVALAAILLALGLLSTAGRWRSTIASGRTSSTASTGR